MDKLSDAHGAFRAAGQLMAAIAEGISIESVSTKGIEIKETDDRSRQSRRCSVLTEVAIGLAGIAAEERYGFGTAPPDQSGRPSVCVHWAFSVQQLADFATVRDLIATIDPDDNDDVLLQAWEQALSLVDDNATWEAIEFFAPLIDAAVLDVVDIDYL